MSGKRPRIDQRPESSPSVSILSPTRLFAEGELQTIEVASLRMELEEVHLRESQLMSELLSHQDQLNSALRKQDLLQNDLELERKKLAEREEEFRKKEKEWSEKLFNQNCELVSIKQDLFHLQQEKTSVEKQWQEKIRKLEAENKRLQEASVESKPAPIITTSTTTFLPPPPSSSSLSPNSKEKIQEQEFLIQQLRNELNHCEQVLKKKGNVVGVESAVNTEELRERVRELEHQVLQIEAANVKAIQAENDKIAALEMLGRWNHVLDVLGGNMQFPEQVIQCVAEARKQSLVSLSNIGELKAQVASLQHQLESLKGDRDDLMVKLAQEEQERRNIQADIRRALEGEAIAKEMAHNAQLALNSLNPEHAVEIYKHCEQLEEENKTLTLKMNSETQGWAEQINSLTRNVENLSAERDELQKKMMQITAQVQQLETEKMGITATLDERTQKFKKTMTSATNKIDVLSKAIQHGLGWSVKSTENNVIVFQPAVSPDYKLYLSFLEDAGGWVVADNDNDDPDDYLDVLPPIYLAHKTLELYEPEQPVGEEEEEGGGEEGDGNNGEENEEYDADNADQ